MRYVGGYCLALDMTEVNLTDAAIKTGRPWTFGKGFDTACPVSRFVGADELKDPGDTEIWCRVNGAEVQRASTSDLAFSVPEMIAHITKYVTLEPGDLLLTGSPPGIGPVRPGDVIEAGLADILTMTFPVRSA
ncbi:acylpyruvase FAHD1, mitochondrial isoform X2 [Bacillus rossius redtenbacheri]